MGGVNQMIKPNVLVWYEGDEVVSSNHAKCEKIKASYL